MSSSACSNCRRAGEKLFLKGERCFSPKCAITRRNYVPGQHGAQSQGGGQRLSEYGKQLREKQKVKEIYGLRERQFQNVYAGAIKDEGVTGDIMLQVLEQRLDNVLYRAHFASSRDQARQIASHGHILVNGKIATTPSALMTPGATIAVKPASQKLPYFVQLKQSLKGKKFPSWLTVDMDSLSASITSTPTVDELDHRPQMQLIVEFYSR